MSRFSGNEERCVCGLTYGRFRTGFTYQDVWEMLRDDTDDPSRWRYKTRGVILGQWFEIKQSMWERHKEICNQNDNAPAP